MAAGLLTDAEFFGPPDAQGAPALLSDEEFLGGSEGLLSDDEFLGGGAAQPPEPDRGGMVYERTRAGLYGLGAGMEATGALANARQIEVLDRLDRGEVLPQNIDPAGFQNFTPEARAKVRSRLEADLGRGIAEMVRQQGEAERTPMSETTRRVLDAKTTGEALDAFTEAPATFIAEIGLESLPAQAPGLVLGLGAGALAGRAAFAAGLGTSSFAVDFGSQVAGALTDLGVDVRDPRAVEAAMRDPAIAAKVRERAQLHAMPVAALDAVSAGLAGRALAPARVKGPVARQAINIPAQLGVQAVAGAAGEAAGEIASGQPLQPGQILAEAAGEMFGAPAEVLGARSATGAPPRAITRPEAVQREIDRLTPEDRASPIPDDLIAEGRAIINEPPPDLPAGALPAEDIIGAEDARPLADLLAERFPDLPVETPPAAAPAAHGAQVAPAAPQVAEAPAEAAPAPALLTDAEFLGAPAQPSRAAPERRGPYYDEFRALLPKDAQGEPDVASAGAAIIQAVAGEAKPWSNLTLDERAQAIDRARALTAPQETARDTQRGIEARRPVEGRETDGQLPEQETGPGTAPADRVPQEGQAGRDRDVAEGLTPADVHAAADRAGIAWDNNPAFAAFTERLTGKRHLDAMTPAELATTRQAIAAGQRPETAEDREPAADTIHLAPRSILERALAQAVIPRSRIGYRGTKAMAQAEIKGQTAAEARRIQDAIARQTGISRNRSEAAKTRKTGPQDLIQFLAANGGIQDQRGELRAMDLHRLFVPGYGKLVRPTGMRLEQARERAQQAGYLPPDAPDAPPEIGTNELLDKIAESRDKPVYREADRSEVMAREATEAEARDTEALERAVDDAIGDTVFTPAERAAVVALVKDGMDPHDAVERVLIQNEAAWIEENAPDEPTESEPDRAGREAAEIGARPEDRPSGAEGSTPDRVEPREAGPAQEGEDGGEVGPRFSLPRGANDNALVAYLRQQRDGSADVARQPSGKPLNQLQRAAYLAGYDTRVAEIEGSEPAPYDARFDKVRRWFGHGEGTVGFHVGRFQRGEGRPRPAIDATDQGDQRVIPGAERIADRELAERKSQGRLAPKKPQQDADEGLFDTGARKQGSLFSLTPRAAERMPAVVADLRARLDALGLKDVGLRLENTIRAGAQSAYGRYRPAQWKTLQSVIEVAVAAPDKALTLDHEAIHALRDLGVFRPSEWSTLRRAAEADTARMAEIRERYARLDLTEEQLIEEAVADMFADWRAGRMEARGFIRSAFERVRQFIDALASALRGQGFDTAESVFGRIESGRIGGRERAGTMDATDPRFHAAYHGSPHDFDEFSTEKIGTGEGAQAYGWGLYFAGKKGVAEFYRDKLASNQRAQRVVQRIEDTARDNPEEYDPLVRAHAGVPFDEFMRRSERDFEEGASEADVSAGELRNLIEDELTTDGNFDPRRTDFRAAYEFLIEGKRPQGKGRLYKVDLAPKEQEYLDWDKPLAQQSERVNTAIDKIPQHVLDWIEDQLEARGMNGIEPRDPTYTGGELYQALTQFATEDTLSTVGHENPKQEASAFLRELGIPGIRYLDQGSRGRGDGSHNYVIFDASAVKIEEKFSLPRRRPRGDSVAERQATAQNFIAKGQPLDRALRVPFDFFGGVDAKGEWKPGQRISKSAERIITEAKFSPGGRFAWLNGTLNAARAGLIDRYGLSEEYVSRERRRDLDERRIALQGAEILKTLKEQDIGVAEARVLQAILTGEAVADADMQKLAVPIRQAIDELGQEAVSLGLVSPESYQRNRGTYLHRVYLKHEGGEMALTRWYGQLLSRRRKKIVGDAFKGRGMFLEVPADRAMQDAPGFAEGGRGLPVKGEKIIILDKYADQRTFDNVTPAAPKIERRVYWPADQAIPDRYRDFTDNGTWEVRGRKGDSIVLWRDYTKIEREKMGEILDARYTIGKTFTILAHDLATGRFYKDIAENGAWTRNAEPNTKWVNGSEFSRWWNDDEVEWVKVPDTDIPQSGGKKRWGALAGKFVRAEIWRDINELDIMSRPNLWTKLLTIWKLNKTGRSPVVHLNNIMSNFVFMDLADVRLQDLVNGIRAYVQETGDFQEASANGAFGADIISQEIKRNVLQPILDDLQRDMTGGINPVMGRARALGRIAEAGWSKAKAADRKMIDMYRLEDEIFRMATYMRRRALGETPEIAAAEARAQFLDYDIRAPWVNAARRSVLPFIAYTYRAVPVIARSVATRPWKLAKYFAIAYAANALAYMIDEGDEDEERRSIREEEKGYTWIGVPRMLRMPYRDAYGNPVFLDVRRWIPAGDVFDVSQGHGVLSMPAPLGFGGPLMIGMELAFNRSAFTGQDIVNPLTDDPWDRGRKSAEHLYKSWMPSAAWIPGSWYWDKIDRAAGILGERATDTQGREYSWPEAVASSFGVKLKPQDVEENFNFRQYGFAKQRRALDEEARRIDRRRDRKMISEPAYDRAIEDIERKRARIDAEEDRVLTGATTR